MKAFCLLFLALGDLIFLKNGKTIEGVYVGEDERLVRYRLASGRLCAEPRRNVVKIERSCTKTNMYEAVASTLVVERPGEYFYLCSWAEEQGLEPPANKLCAVALSDEELKGRALLRLSGDPTAQEAHTLLRSAVVASPELIGAVAALRSARRKRELPQAFLSAFTGALEDAIGASYAEALAGSKSALGQLDPAQRQGVDAAFRRLTRMAADVYLSRLKALASKGGQRGRCRFCRGTGLLTCKECKGKGWKPCPRCNGSGYATRMTMVLGLGWQDHLLECAACKGSGRIHCSACIPLERPVEERVYINLPRQLDRRDHMPHAQVTSPSSSAEPKTSTDTSVSRVRVAFEKRRSGKKTCPHCADKEEDRGGRFTADELAGLVDLARLWKDALESRGGGWRANAKLCGLGELYAALRFRPEEATAFHQGKWVTPGEQRKHVSALVQLVRGAVVSEFEEWKTGYKCRMISEKAIRIPGEPGAWLGLFRLYLHTGEVDLTRRFASRQVYHASFSSRSREASFLSPRGELVAVTGKAGLILQPDRALDTGGAGQVELWFRVLNVSEDPRPVLAVQVLAARWGGKTDVFF